MAQKHRDPDGNSSRTAQLSETLKMMGSTTSGQPSTEHDDRYPLARMLQPVFFCAMEDEIAKRLAVIAKSKELSAAYLETTEQYEKLVGKID